MHLLDNTMLRRLQKQVDALEKTIREGVDARVAKLEAELAIINAKLAAEGLPVYRDMVALPDGAKYVGQYVGPSVRFDGSKCDLSPVKRGPGRPRKNT